jgi:hypothetical protein
MKHRRMASLAVVLAAVNLTACTRYFNNIDNMYLQPGATDPAVPSARNIYTTRTMKFLGKYRVTYQWLHDGCEIDSAVNLRLPLQGNLRREYSKPIYEADGHLWAEPFLPEQAPTNRDKFFKSIMKSYPIYGRQPNGAIDINNIIRDRMLETGREPACITFWKGIRQHVSINFTDRTLADVEKVLDRVLEKENITKSTHVIGGNTWLTYKRPVVSTTIGYGNYYWTYFTPILDSGYLVEAGLAANAESLKSPESFSALEDFFQRMLAAVEIAPWTEADEKEQAEMRRRAVESMRLDCVAQAKRSKPAPWCGRYLDASSGSLR